MRRGRLWTEDEVICAKFLRHCGMADKDIGEILGGRSAASVAGKIGNGTHRPFVVNATGALFEAARAGAAKMLGQAADEFETRGRA